MLKFTIILAAAAVCSGHTVANTYHLHTGNLATVEIDTTATQLPAEYNPGSDTIILIHGHGGSTRDDFNFEITPTIPSTHNVIIVDWENEAKQTYAIASRFVQLVAADLSRFLTWLSVTPGTGNQPTVTTMNKVHLVGFGLGAHIAGIAGRNLPSNLGLVGRITGLDPSGSGWGSNSARLRNSDAIYVEVIHTDGSGLLANGIGTAIGDVNFYANGGSNQPGCFSHSCSHNRAYELFAASMLGHLEGSACNSMTQMNLNLCRGAQLNMGGIEMNKSRINNIYRINTSRRFPF